MLSNSPQTKEQCEAEMANYLADNPNNKKFRVEFCKDAGEWVVQVREPSGNWLCLHNDNEDEDTGEICPECGNYTLMPAMFTGVGKALTEGFRCPDPACGYNS